MKLNRAKTDFKFEEADREGYLVLERWLHTYAHINSYRIKPSLFSYDGQVVDLEGLSKLVGYVNKTYGIYIRDYQKTKSKKNIIRKFLKDPNIILRRVPTNDYRGSVQRYDLRALKH
jgi:hypothetical protein